MIIDFLLGSLFIMLCILLGLSYLKKRMKKETCWIEIQEKNHKAGVFVPSKDDLNILEGNVESYYD